MTWPRLSEGLKGPRDPGACQRCGLRPLVADAGQLARWQEHDEQDRPESIVVVLCEPCSGRVIGPHVRLYRELDPNEPFPGSMAICLGCRHRAGVRCASPAAKLNGGPGLAYDIAEPTRVHVLRRGKGRRSGWMTIWPEPAKACSGREGMAAC